MREPKRLLTQGATDFERQLLKSVMNERPSGLLRSRMQRGLGLVGPLAWASNVKAMFNTLTTKATVSVAVGGIVAAGGMAAVGVTLESGSEGSASDFASSESRPAERAQLPVASRLETGLIAPPVGELPVQKVETLPELEASRAEVSRAEVSRAEAEVNSQLRKEIALLDGARAALQQGARTRAVEALDAYRERFPAGILGREAKLLRRHAASKESSRGGTRGRER